MLFMDALEIDNMSDGEGLPDLLPGHMDREISKAALAFSCGRYEEVWTGLWGCGAFGGDPGVKMLCVWCAASMAGTKLRIVCDASQRDIGRQLQDFFVVAQGCLDTVKELRGLLGRAPLSLRRMHTLELFSENLLEK